MLFGYGLMLISLLGERSPTGGIFGLYSAKYLALLSGLALAWFAGAYVVLFRLPLLSRQVESVRKRLPSALMDIACVEGAVLLGWIIRYPLFGFMVQPLFVGGLVLAYAGLLFLRAEYPVTEFSIVGWLLGAFSLLWIFALRPDWIFGQGWGIVLTPVVGVLGWWQDRTGVARLPERLSANGILIAALTGLGVLVYAGLAYQPAAEQMLTRDELYFINFTSAQPLWQIFIHSAYPFLYRPFQALELWLWFQVFGPNHAVYQWVGLALYAASALMVVWCLNAVGASKGLTALMSLLLVSHLFSQDILALWPADTIILQGIATGGLALLLVKQTDKAYWYVGVFGLLLLSLLARESAFALVAGALVYAGAGYFTQRLERRPALLLALVCIASVVVYFALRWLALGSPMGASTSVDTCSWNQCYTAAEVAALALPARLGLYVYTASANLVSMFLPFTTNDGLVVFETMRLWAILVGVLVILGAVCAVAIRVNAQDQQTDSRWQLGALIFCVLAGLVLLGLILWPPVEWVGALPQLELALYGVLGCGMGLSLLARPNLNRTQWLLCAFALGLIIGGSVAAFPYSRYRTHYLPLIGWGILLVFSLQALQDSVGWQRYTRGVMLAAMLALIVGSGIAVRETLPRPILLAENFMQGNNLLCDPTISPEIALQVAHQYNITDQVEACRAP